MASSRALWHEKSSDASCIPLCMTTSVCTPASLPRCHARIRREEGRGPKSIRKVLPAVYSRSSWKQPDKALTLNPPALPSYSAAGATVWECLKGGTKSRANKGLSCAFCHKGKRGEEENLFDPDVDEASMRGELPPQSASHARQIILSVTLGHSEYAVHACRRREMAASTATAPRLLKLQNPLQTAIPPSILHVG